MKQREFVGDVVGWDEASAEALFAEFSTWTIGALTKEVGGLSAPEKMPCNSYNLPALSTCKLGSVLAKIKGSVCGDCYALKGRYAFPGVERALVRRMDIQTGDPTRWGAAMAALIGKKSGPRSTHFRFHDSGETRGPVHARILLWIGAKCPHVKFWIPTREYGTWAPLASEVPENVTVRMSAHMVGARPPAVSGFPSSTVGWEGAPNDCPAPNQEGKCKDCRRCWDRDFTNVNYHPH